jgi:YVTN family beta-propeller protein
MISGTTISATIQGFSNPWGIVYDPAEGGMAVTNRGSDNVTLLYGKSLHFDEGVGSLPSGIAYSPYDNALLVTNYGGSNVTAFNAQFQSLGLSIRVGSDPWGIAYDPANQLTYVANYGSNNVTVIDPYGNQYANIGVGSGPESIAFDQNDLRVYVTDFGGNSVTIIRGYVVKQTVSLTGDGPAGVAYNGDDLKMYVTAYVCCDRTSCRLNCQDMLPPRGRGGCGQRRCSPPSASRQTTPGTGGPGLGDLQGLWDLRAHPEVLVPKLPRARC